MMTLTIAQMVAVLAAYSAAALTTLKLKLYKSNTPPSPSMVIGDFTEADFTGYAAASIAAFNAPYYDTGLAKARCQSPNTSFVSTGSAVGNVVYGWYLTDSAGTLLIAAGQFDTPVNIAASGDGVSVVAEIQYGG